MRSAAAAVVSSLLGCVAAFGQSQHFLYICDLVNGSTDCYSIDTSVMGGVRFDDYKVTLDSSDVLYVGAAPGELFSQLNIRIPSGVRAGNQPRAPQRIEQDGPALL